MAEKYSNGKIYTIRCRSDNLLIYVGSTIESLSQRFARHKRCCYNEKERGYNMLLYQTIRSKEWDDFYIELYENCSCKSKKELNKREGEVIREIGTLNVKISGNVIEKKAYGKSYYQRNKDKWNTEEAIQQRKAYEQTEKYKEIKKKCDSKRYLKNKDQTSGIGYLPKEGNSLGDSSTNIT
jgi:hypothetical protein